MDSKTRHELEKNELLKWLTNQYEDWIRPNKHWLGYAVLGLLVVIVIIFATARVNTWNQNAAWKQFYAALNSPNATVELELVANSTSGIVGANARLALAQRQLTEGSTQAYIDKSEAIVHLEKAVASFQQVQKATSDSTLLQKAGFGLGQCWETLAAVRVGDDFAKAEEEYKSVAERWEDSFMGQRAQKQLALIRQPTTRMVLERLATKVPEIPAGMEGFRVDFDREDPFYPGAGFDLDSMFNQGTFQQETPFLEFQRPSAEQAEPVQTEQIPTPIPTQNEPEE